MSDAATDSANLPAVAADPGLVTQITSKIDLTDRAMITSFGDKAQRDVAAFADRVLAQTRNKEMGGTGKLLLDVIDKARGLDPSDLKDAGIIERLVSSAERRMKRFIGRFEDVAAQIEAIVIELDKHKDLLRRDISLLDDLHEETRRAIAFLEAHVAAGKAYAETFKTGRLPELQAKAGPGSGGRNLVAAQEYQDAVQALDRLEKRIFYLQQARQIGIQQLPQIRIVQAGDETLIENLQATTQLTIPVWKQKMILLLGLTRQKRGARTAEDGDRRDEPDDAPGVGDDEGAGGRDRAPGAARHHRHRNARADEQRPDRHGRIPCCTSRKKAAGSARRPKSE